MIRFSLITHFWSIFIPFNSSLKPDFNCSKKLLSSFDDKVTTGTYNFVSVILNIACIGAFIAGLPGLSPWDAFAVCVLILSLFLVNGPQAL